MCIKSTNSNKNIKATTLFVVFLFVHSWEQRKLGETTQIIMGQSPDGSTYSDFPTDYILVQGNADLENGWVKPRIWTTQKTKYAVAGDLIMSVRAPAGSMGKTAYNVVLGRGVAAIKGNEFIFQVLTKMDLEGFWKKLSAGSTFESLNSDNIINANINLPSNLEQDKIGSIFENIDNLITLHQRKGFSRFSQILRRKKHSFLPIAWEQRKLYDIADRFDNLRIPVAANLRIHGITPYYGANGIQDYVSGYTHDGEFVLVAEDGANDLKNYPVNYVKGRIWVNNHAHVLQGKAKLLDNKFLSYLINRADIESLLVGCGRAKLNAETMMNIVFLVPNYEEQIEIGNYLSKIDNLITLHQCKVFYKKVFFKNEIFNSFEFGNNITWEQRKLGDMVKEVTRRDPNSNAPIMMITANNGFIEQSERYAFNNAGESLKKYIILQKEELAYNHGASKLRPYGSCFALATAENARVPFVYHCFSAERMNPEFLSIELNGNEIESQLRSIVSSGARMDGLLNISFGEYTSVSILFPKKNEQDKIADFFRQLDNLITLHQRIKIFFTGDYHDKKNKQHNFSERIILGLF